MVASSTLNGSKKLCTTFLLFFAPGLSALQYIPKNTSTCIMKCMYGICSSYQKEMICICAKMYGHYGNNGIPTFH